MKFSGEWELRYFAIFKMKFHFLHGEFEKHECKISWWWRLKGREKDRKKKIKQLGKGTRLEEKWVNEGVEKKRDERQHALELTNLSKSPFSQTDQMYRKRFIIVIIEKERWKQDFEYRSRKGNS